MMMIIAVLQVKYVPLLLYVLLYRRYITFRVTQININLQW
jgi:hypothetical protein